MKERVGWKREIWRKTLGMLMAAIMLIGIMPMERVQAETYNPIPVNLYGQRGSAHCAEACIACVEAYHIGLNEDDNEAIYWTAWAVTGGGAYMPNAGDGLKALSDKSARTICNEIDKGNPVYLYFKKGDGLQDKHWVVAYGYEGDGTDFDKILVMSPMIWNEKPYAEKGTISYFRNRVYSKGTPAPGREKFSITYLKRAEIRDGGYIDGVDKNVVIADKVFQNIKVSDYNGTDAKISFMLRPHDKDGHDCNDLGVMIGTNPQMISCVTCKKSDINSPTNGIFKEEISPDFVISKYADKIQLNANTTYYFQVFIVKNGITIKSKVRELRNGTPGPVEVQDKPLGTLSVIGELDGVSQNNLNNIGTFDVYINQNGQEELWKNDISELMEVSLPEGTKYRITDVKGLNGKIYKGNSGNLEGTIVANACVVAQLKYKTDPNAPKTYPEILLHVPYYPQKRTDVDDCGISAIAMIEGYARGYDKSKYSEMYDLVYRTNNNQTTPNAVVKYSRYIEAEAVLGEPFDLSKDLSLLYQCLQNGKPILIHREGGADHWSVIVGYNGSKTNLELSGFIVWNTMSGVKELDYDEVLPVSANKTAKRGIDLQTWVNKSSTKKLTNVKVRYLGVEDSPQMGRLDLKGFLDGNLTGSLAGYGTADVWIYEDGKYVKKANDCSDYNVEWQEGMKYRIDDIKAFMGKKYNGVKQGALEGTIKGNATTSVVLNFSTVSVSVSPGTLNLNLTDAKSGQMVLDYSNCPGAFYIYHDYDGGMLDLKVDSDYANQHQIFTFTALSAGTTTVTIRVANQENVELTRTSFQISVADTEKPAITELWVSDVDNTGYTVNCRPTDNVGIKEVRFPTWTDANGQDDLAAVWPSITTAVDGVYSYRVNVSDHNNESGTYVTHVYPFDVAGNHISKEIRAYVDGVNPVITEVWITDLDHAGYTVNCKVTDDREMWYVAFPTWTELNGQDDLSAVWPCISAPTNDVYSYRVNAADHNNEIGLYHTHIYAYDKAKNYSVVGWDVMVPRENTIYFDNDDITLDAGTNVNNHYCFTGDGIKSIACEVEKPEVCRVDMYEPTWSNNDGYMTIFGLKAGTSKVTLSFVNETSERFYQKSFVVEVKALYQTIRFEANGGSGSMEGKSVELGSSYALPACTFTAPDGMEFAGWDINGTVFEAGKSITVNEDITVNATWREVILEKDPVIMNSALATFEGKIGVVFRMELPDYVRNDEGAYAVFTKNGKESKMLVSEAIVEENKGKTLYRFTKYVVAKEYRENINIRLFDRNGDPITVKGTSGTDYTATGVNYSLEKYISKKKTSTDEKMAALAVALEDYCTAAQIYFVYDANGLVASDRVKAVTKDQLEGYKGVFEGTMPTGMAGRSISASFESDNAFKMFYTFDEDINPKDFVYAIDGNPTTLYEEDGKYFLMTANVAAKNLDRVYTYTITKDGVTYVVKCSVLTYARSSVNNGTEERQNLGKSLYLYNQAAKAYFAK